LAVVVLAIVMVVVPSVGHIETSIRMVPMPVSLTDPNTDAADPDIGVFRDDHRFERSPSRCSPECDLGIPVVCIKLTSAVLETPAGRT
jgi:hypothetical protein